MTACRKAWRHHLPAICFRWSLVAGGYRVICDALVPFAAVLPFAEVAGIPDLLARYRTWWIWRRAIRVLTVEWNPPGQSGTS